MFADKDSSAAVSVIVPTIGRPQSLRRLLDSLCLQTTKVHEVIVADGSTADETAGVVADACWQQAKLTAKRVAVHPPNAVRQRQAAIAAATGGLMLLLDDDVELEPDCVEQMLETMRSSGNVVGVFGDFHNQSWPMPTRVWRFYLRYVLGMQEGAWQGRVVGPLLRFCYHPVPAEPRPLEWIGSGNSLIRRDALEQAGGFSHFFLHRCTMNEDVDLGLKLAKLGRILFCPAARMAHHQAPGGRVRPALVAEDDLYNRFLVLHCTVGKSKIRAFGLTVLFFSVETLSAVYWSTRRLKMKLLLVPLLGRTRALFRIVPMLFRRIDCT
jgi:GT2 family glycosyltransferase